MSKKREFRENGFIYYGWMVEDMELYGNELIIYSILNSVCQIPGMSYYGSKEYLGKFVGSTRTAIRVLNSLIEKGYVKKRVISGNRTEYIALVVKKNSSSKKDESDNLTVTNCHSDCDKMSYSTVTNCHSDYDKMSHKYINKYINKYIKKDIKSDEPTLSLQETESEDPEEQKKKQRAPFQKPTVEEIDSYIRNKGYPVDAQEFYNYYEDKEWHCGKIPMRNWKNAVYAWNKNQKRWSDEKAQKAADKNSFQQNEYDFEALEKELRAN